MTRQRFLYLFGLSNVTRAQLEAYEASFPGKKRRWPNIPDLATALMVFLLGVILMVGRFTFFGAPVTTPFYSDSVKAKKVNEIQSRIEALNEEIAATEAAQVYSGPVEYAVDRVASVKSFILRLPVIRDLAKSTGERFMGMAVYAILLYAGLTIVIIVDSFLQRHSAKRRTRSGLMIHALWSIGVFMLTSLVIVGFIVWERRRF